MLQAQHTRDSCSRREFLRSLSLSGAALFAVPHWARNDAHGWGQRDFRVRRLSRHLTVISGSVNGALLSRDRGVLAIGGDPRPNPTVAERVLFTHHRRDAIWAGRRLAERGAMVVVPEKEKDKFTDVKSFWDSFPEKRFHDYVQPTTKVSVEPWHVSETVSEGSVLQWRGLRIRVLETPGYTRGAVTYVTEVDGRRVAFTGDLIYGDGQILDLYSLQDSIPEVRALGYHGFMARAAPLIRSLERVAQERPDLLVPTRGPLIENSQQAIERLIRRLRAVYRNYLSVCDLRWFVPERMQILANRMLGEGAEVSYMPAAETVSELPTWLRVIENSRLLVSDSGSAFLIDCGGADDRVIKGIKTLHQSSQISSIDGIYITHYHDDHTGQAQAAAQAFGCPVYTCKEIGDILRNPRSYRMPAQHHEPIHNLVPLQEGETLKWKEFNLTSFFFPGQTLYHGALKVTRVSGERVWFIGDSFTPTGFGDHCPQNRNFLREGAGFMYCLDRLAEEPGCLLVNQHVKQMFRFSPDQIAHLKKTYRQRLELLRELFPWDDPNFGLDEGWARCYPYEVRVRHGQSAEIAVRLLNHSAQSRIFSIQFHPPIGWRVMRNKRSIRLRPREEGDLIIGMIPTAHVRTGTHILTADVMMDGFSFPRWVEGIIKVEAA